jgi:hypothetical protein
LHQLGLDDCCPRAAFVVAAMKAVMQVERVQPMINDLFNHLPDGFQQPDAAVVPPALWNKDNYYPKELARDLAVSLGRLDQLDKMAPMVPIAGAAP